MTANRENEAAKITLGGAIELVADFHRAIGARVSDTATLLPGDTEAVGPVAAELRHVQTRCLELVCGHDELLQRLAMAIEELAEWAEAHAKRDLIAAADAWGDRLYVLLGDAVAAGLPGEGIFEEVHRSNMTKRRHRAEDGGKAIKDAAFDSPKLVSLLGKF